MEVTNHLLTGMILQVGWPVIILPQINRYSSSSYPLNIQANTECEVWVSERATKIHTKHGSGCLEMLGDVCVESKILYIPKDPDMSWERDSPYIPILVMGLRSSILL